MSWHAEDLIMTRLVETIIAPVVSSQTDLYVGLLESVISQQLSVKVADIIYARFCGLFENNNPLAEQVLLTDTEKLRSIGLSGQKVNYIRNIATFHQQYPITMDRLAPLTDEEIITHLTQIKGVGRWTVQMLLMFPMNRPDIFPIDDLIIRQSMVELYKVNETGKELHKRLHEIAERWKPNRTLACKYLWRSRDKKYLLLVQPTQDTITQIV
ncbi:DNA-3-methyladenine glycosylase 2 family protein [Cytophagaceae bacterium YF14B1]|uniref:DNA-3-methyladenine glycosylase II n=1 Tax=Xanthocytophaga flava TaxID=3048013 RepID=A0AAE3U6M2_9BACT|nr:DNA-3-methyladenine glycosylase 2 family protein [Xanthocytophaga flavus]MDJ1479238.1 DNA-3-methyladenine glycosylase 2 family protein [Xanthocytophaga flavus]